MRTVSSIRLFDVEPDLARYLSREDRDTVRQLHLPLLEVPPGRAPIRELLDPMQAFGAIVIDGMILQSMRLGEHGGLRLIGPGDVLSLTETAPSMLLLDWDCRATSPSHLAVLGRDFLIAARRWPWLTAGLHARSGEQAERLATQMMICQLPRVDDRLLAMMWLLSESWGQVTASGTVLPIELTHSALGGLIGARRPTVTLALSELSERGAVVRQRSGWLLLEPPKAPSAAAGDDPGEPRLLTPPVSVWTAEPPSETDAWLADDLAHAELRETVKELRTEHIRRTARMQRSLDEMVTRRAAIAERRQSIRRSAPSPRPELPETPRRAAPSS